MADLERRLRELGEAWDVPPTPDLAPRVAARLADRAVPAARPIRRRAIVAVVLALVALGTLAAIAPAREAILDALGIGGETIRRVPTLPPPARPALGPDDLGERVTFAEAIRRSPVPIRRPLLPDVGPPDEVYRLEPPPGGLVTFLWRARPGLPRAAETGAGLLMTQVEGVSVIEKTVAPGTALEPVTVNGSPGVWIAGGPHVVGVVDSAGAFPPGGDPSRRQRPRLGSRRRHLPPRGSDLEGARGQDRGVGEVSRRVALAVVLAATCLAAGRASGKELPPDLQVAADGAGDVHVTWVQPALGARHRVRSAGTGRWSRVQELPGGLPISARLVAGKGDGVIVSCTGLDGQTQLFELDGGPARRRALPNSVARAGAVLALAGDPHGELDAVWNRSQGTAAWLVAARRSATGAWSPTRRIAGSGGLAYEVRLIPLRGHGVVAAWIDVDGPSGRSRLRSSARSGPDDWTPARSVSAWGVLEGLDIEAGPSGEVVALWVRDGRVEVRERSPAGDWGPVRVLSDLIAGLPDVAIAPDGRAYAAWTLLGRRETRAQIAERPPGGGWSGPSGLPRLGGADCQARIAATASEVVVLWTAARAADTSCVLEPWSHPTSAELVAAARPSRPWLRWWTAPRRLDTSATSPRLVPATGGVVAVWGRPGDRPSVRSAARPDGGAWKEPQEILSTGR